jgi:UDP-N-acetylglucosamine/UDP-N-acetylgalactosamine diphosphorylase
MDGAARGGRTDHIPACLVYSRGASPQSAITTIVHTLQTTETVMEISIIRERLEAIDQAHVLTYFDELTPAEQHALLEQINDIDLAALPQLIETYVRRTPEIAIPDDLAPAPYYPADPASAVRPYDAARFRKIGEEIIAAGKLAVFTVAGGQGTRLGFDGPKGAFPGSAVTRKPLFQIFAEGIAATQRKYGCTVPWYIMTSPLNDAATRAFFDEHSFFGLDRSNVMFLMQGVMPSFDLETGKLLLAEKGKLATNPDGHGGSLRALFNAGALDDMQARGCEQISYHQVDNPNVKVADPLFVGLHAAAEDSSGEMSSKMVTKVAALEKVGNFCLADGKTTVIEYSDLPDELAQQKSADGSLRFIAGSVAIHMISCAFVRHLNTAEAGPGGFSLPMHRAVKKVPHIDLATGRTVEPTEPNAVKLEAFIFDALPLCESSIVLETNRTEEFAPIKNASGVDSVETSAQIQSNRNGGWLETVGVTVPRKGDGDVDAVIEISPLTALEPDDLRGKAIPDVINPGATVSL